MRRWWWFSFLSFPRASSTLMKSSYELPTSIKSSPTKLKKQSRPHWSDMSVRTCTVHALLVDHVHDVTLVNVRRSCNDPVAEERNNSIETPSAFVGLNRCPINHIYVVRRHGTLPCVWDGHARTIPVPASASVSAGSLLFHF